MSVADAGDARAAQTLTVYPTALKAGAALRDDARRTGCILGRRATTFPELTDALARDLDVAPRVLEPHLAAVVLERALATVRLPPVFREARAGLVRELLAVIGELESAFLSPDDVAELARALGGAAGARLADVAAVYAAYAAGLARVGAVDRHGREWRVCEALAQAEARAARPATLAGVARVVFAEIYDFSILQFLIATSVIRLVGDAELIAFAHPENVDATRFLERTWNRFVGDPAIADQVLPSFVVRGGRQGSLATVLRDVFTAEPAGDAPDDGAVRILVAPERYREVEAVGREVRARLATQGARPERIALLARDMSVYGDLIDDVCRRFAVPVRFRRGEPLLANGLVKACLELVRLVADGVPRARLEAILDSDYFGATDARLVRLVREVGFVAETARPLADCVAHAVAARAAEADDAGLSPERRARAAKRRERLLAGAPRLAALIETLRALDGDRSVAAHVARLRGVLRRLGFRPVRAEEHAPAAARRDTRAWERLQATLDELAGLTRALGVPRVAPAAFLRMLVAALEAQATDEPPAPTGVHALSVLDARGLDFDVVYLLGMDDGTFPAPRAESPLWPDAVKRQANPLAADVLRRKLGARAAGLPLGGLLRTAREASLEDPFLFFLALSMPERELVLSYPAADDGGNPTVPSPFLDDVRACFAGGPRETRVPPLPLVPLAADAGEAGEIVARAALDRWTARGPDRLTAALRARLAGGAARLDAIDVRARIEERRSRYFLLPRSAAEAKEALAGAHVGRLAEAPPPTALPRAWTPSRLEVLGACGFKFFAASVLGLDTDPEPSVELLPLETGALLHRMLEEVHRRLRTLPTDPAAARAAVCDVLAAARPVAASAVVAKDEALLAVAWDRLAAAIAELVVAEWRDDPGVETVREVEVPFELTLDGDPPVPVSGRSDLCEVRRRDGVVVGVRVVDYKATRDRQRYAALVEKQLGITGFQIPVYLLAALERLAPLSPDLELDGGYLFPFLDASHRTKLRAFSREGLAEIATAIRDLVARARAGRFDVDPTVCDQYCAYRKLCRYQKPPLEETPGDV